MGSRKKMARCELEFLKKSLKGEISYKEGVQILNIDDTIGNGHVRCICFDDGLVAFEFDITLNKNSDIFLNTERANTMDFLYCLKGNCSHMFVNSDYPSKIERLQTAAIGNDDELTSKLLVKKKERLILNIIRIDKNKYIEKFVVKKGIDDNTTGLIDSLKGNNFFHLGKINLEIGELIKLLDDLKYVDNFSKFMQFKGICYLILARHITQFNFEMQHAQNSSTTLLKRELKQISETSNFIVEYPEFQHSITALCEKSGLSAAKLQQGFHFLHAMTVGEFIRDTRLCKAVQLLRTTDMNISEVVYTIGFTSRSYFCKIFKAKYSCNPKQYKQNLVRTVANSEA